MAIFTRTQPPPDVARSAGALANWAAEQGRQTWLDAEARVRYDNEHGDTLADRLHRARQVTQAEQAALDAAAVGVTLAEARVTAAERAVALLTMPTRTRSLGYDNDGNQLLPSQATMERWEAEDRAARLAYTATGGRLKAELAEAQGALALARLGAQDAKELLHRGRRERVAKVTGKVQ